MCVCVCVCVCVCARACVCVCVCVCVLGGDNMNMWESFAWVENEFAGNLNINFKIYPYYDDM